MGATDWLTQDELLAELDKAGLTLAERTLRFWVAKGVLATPVKKPFSGADGRVGYYPRETLALVPQILKLQDEGWKLRQIAHRLQQPVAAEKPQRSQPAGGAAAEDLALRFLQDLMTDSEPRDRRRCFSSPAASGNELRQIRHYLVARLERLVGRSVAVRATSSFLLSLEPREMKKLATRLKVSSSLRRAEPAGEDGFDRRRVAELLATQDRVELAQRIAAQRQRLEEFGSSAGSSPLLLRRALSTLHSLEQLLQGQKKETSSIADHLGVLGQIEAQATGNLQFLQETGGKSDTV